MAGEATKRAGIAPDRIVEAARVEAQVLRQQAARVGDRTAFFLSSRGKRISVRAIQNAMIAARLIEGWRRGDRVFYSMTDRDSTASAQNLADEGFRPRFEIHLYERGV